MSAAISDPEIDAMLTSQGFLMNPYPLMARLRQEHPVYWSDSMGAWVLTRYDDIMVTFRDVANYSNAHRHAAAVEYLPPESRAKFELLESHFQASGLPDCDPPRHGPMRKSVMTNINGRMAPLLRPRIQEILDGLLDNAEPAGSMDVIRDVGLTLPAIVIAELLGVPTDHIGEFTTSAREAVTFYGVNRPAEAVLWRSQEGLGWLRSQLAEIIDDRRRHPGDDVISTLVTAPDGTFTDEDLLSTCVTLMIGGHTTTTALIGNGLLTLLRHPAQWAELQADRSLLPDAIEEVLRYETPVARQPRELLNSVELNGRRLEAGQVVFQMLGAANRDPEHFGDPDRFDIHRSPNRHLAFGYGIHFCVGAPIALLEAQVFFDTILTRFPNIRLRDDVGHWDMNFPNGRLLEFLEVELR